MTPIRAYVGLGANLGNAQATLTAALQSLRALPETTLHQVSAFYLTAPIDSHGPDYVNAVAALDTRLAPLDLLARLQGIENAFGRERPYRNAPRTLDLDLLLYGDASIALPTLTVPHPRMHERAFVLVPLADIAPSELTIPGQGELRALLAGVSGQPTQRQETP